MAQNIDLQKLFEKFERRIEAKNVAKQKEEERQRHEAEKEVDELFFEELLEEDNLEIEDFGYSSIDEVGKIGASLIIEQILGEPKGK